MPGTEPSVIVQPAQLSQTIHSSAFHRWRPQLTRVFGFLRMRRQRMLIATCLQVASVATRTRPQRRNVDSEVVSFYAAIRRCKASFFTNDKNRTRSYIVRTIMPFFCTPLSRCELGGELCKCLPLAKRHTPLCGSECRTPARRSRRAQTFHSPCVVTGRLS